MCVFDVTYLIKRGQYPGGDDGPEADLRKQRERGEKEETIDQQLDGVRIRQLRFGVQGRRTEKESDRWFAWWFACPRSTRITPDTSDNVLVHDTSRN